MTQPSHLLRLVLGSILFSVAPWATGDEIALPPPTGPSAVGRTVYHWIDSSRLEALSDQKSAHRELLVYIWYPAEPQANTEKAAYLPHFELIEATVGETELKKDLGGAYTAVKAGSLRSHSIENAKISSARKQYPLLIFSHGFGETSLMYAGLLEDLASHGYVVAAIEHPYDASCVVFPDGRSVPFARERWASAKQKPDGAVAYQIEQIPIRAADIGFVLRQLITLDKTARLGEPLAGHLDFDRIGVLGHSLGGMAAVRACEKGARFRACMNQDSDYKGVPFIPSAPGVTIKQPFLFFASGSKHQPAPTEEQLARMKLTRAQYDSLVREYHKNQDEALAALKGGAYRVSVETEGFNHRSFIDTNLWLADDKAPTMSNRLKNLEIVRTYTRAFFDKYLKGTKNTVLDNGPAADPDSRIRVDRFGAAKR
jgi:pimeloyl-ACP methyl ester carboxylesterase